MSPICWRTYGQLGDEPARHPARFSWTQRPSDGTMALPVTLFSVLRVIAVLP